MSYILDSTLRDGAYAFGNSMPLAYISYIGKYLDGLVDFIEVGSSISFGYGSSTSFKEDLIRLETLNKILKKSKSVVFIQPSLLKSPLKDLKKICEACPSIVRLGIDPELTKLLDFKIITLLETLEIKYCLNLMKAFKYSQAQLDCITKIANNTKNCLSINVVDSSGCMRSEEVFNITKKISQVSKTDLGVHIHNNIGEANKISCSALEKGFYVDSTLLGKGRMGGNADTVLLVLFRELMRTDNIKNLNLYINKFLECTSMIWGREAREHIISIMIGLTGMHSSKLNDDMISSLEIIPDFSKMISSAWENGK